MTLAVLAPEGDDKSAKGAAKKAGRDQEVDAIDLSRPRGYRPTASGRAPMTGSAWSVPEEALAEATRRDLLRGWITRSGSEVAQLGPADAAGPGLVGGRATGSRTRAGRTGCR